MSSQELMGWQKCQQGSRDSWITVHEGKQGSPTTLPLVQLSLSSGLPLPGPQQKPLRESDSVLKAFWCLPVSFQAYIQYNPQIITKLSQSSVSSIPQPPSRDVLVPLIGWYPGSPKPALISCVGQWMPSACMLVASFVGSPGLTQNLPILALAVVTVLEQGSFLSQVLWTTEA